MKKIVESANITSFKVMEDEDKKEPHERFYLLLSGLKGKVSRFLNETKKDKNLKALYEIFTEYQRETVVKNKVKINDDKLAILLAYPAILYNFKMTHENSKIEIPFKNGGDSFDIPDVQSKDIVELIYKMLQK